VISCNNTSSSQNRNIFLPKQFDKNVLTRVNIEISLYTEHFSPLLLYIILNKHNLLSSQPGTAIVPSLILDTPAGGSLS